MRLDVVIIVIGQKPKEGIADAAGLIEYYCVIPYQMYMLVIMFLHHFLYLLVLKCAVSRSDTSGKKPLCCTI